MSALSAKTARSILALTVLGVSGVICLSVNSPKAQTAAAQDGNAAGAKTATAQIVKAANTFLATLDAQWKKSVLFAFFACLHAR